MWQNIIVFMIVALTAGLVAWQFHRKLTGKSSCCGGCAGRGSCGSASLRPLSGSDFSSDGGPGPGKGDDPGCGCGQHSQTGATPPTARRRP